MLKQALINNVQAALLEDLGTGDLSAALLPNHSVRAQILCREAAVLCGQDWVNEVFHQLEPSIKVQWLAKEGEDIPADTLVCLIEGPVQPILSGERSALNFLQTLSGTATLTRKMAKLIAHTPCKLLDTRKTLPGLRLAQKYAVQIGGGVNHRLGLYDAYLIKENHIAAAGGIHPALSRARALNPDVFLEIEVETLAQFQEAITGKPSRIMLDNFTEAEIISALEIPRNGIPIEVSGGVNEDTLVRLAELGVDFISAGCLTKNLRAIDFSLRLAQN